MIAVAQQHVQAAKLLIDAGGNPNACNSIGRTPLMFASHYGNKPLVKLLLASGADPNLRGFESESLPLAAAAMSGHSDIVRLLLDAGADPMLVDGSGKPPLDLAEGAGHGEVAATLRLKTLRKR
ncbi:Ankyrin repeats (3 copies) [compost metagenome]